MSLDYGFSKALLLRWAPGSANTILLTGRGHGDTTARSLLVQVEDREQAAAVAAAKAAVAGRSAEVAAAAAAGGGGRGTEWVELSILRRMGGMVRMGRRR